MQQTMGYMRRAIEDYKMVESGDKIALAISGGKDSVAMLAGFAGLRRVLKADFSLMAFTLDPCFGGVETDYSAILALARELDVPYIIKRTDIGPIVFDERQEKNPCSLCARMRRGALHDLCNLHGCNKLALGHHMDDAIETFFMNIFNEGRIGCFSPVTYMSRKDIHVIRPMVYLSERQIIGVVNKLSLPVVKSICPNDGISRREWTKAFIRGMEREDRGFRDRVFGALKRSGIDGW